MSPALAQQSSTVGFDSDELFDEITVTARRREESAQEVPISIAVFDQDVLDNLNVVNASDLATYTPSLSVQARFGPDQSSFAIRGFSQELRTTASVAVYFADVVAPRGGGSVSAGDGAGPGSFFDLDSVQILKGPQGTLFGRNTTGGAVLLVPREPSSRYEGYFEASAGDFDMQRAQAVLNIPFSERVRARFGVDYQQRDGYLKNDRGLGPDRLGDLEYVAGRASLSVDVTESIENYSIAAYTDSKNDGVVSGALACNQSVVNGQRLGLAPFCDAVLADQGSDFFAVESATARPLNEIKQAQFINTTTWRATEQLTVKNIFSYSDLEQTMLGSVFGTNFQIPAPVPAIGGLPFSFLNVGQVPGIPTNSQRAVVEELQFQGRALNDRLNWQGGLYYENSEPDGLSGTQIQNLINCASVPGNDPSTFRCQDVLRAAAFFGLGGMVPIAALPAMGNVQRSIGKVEYENEAVYAQATYNITDTLKFTGGARYTWDTTTGTGQQTIFQGFNALMPSAPGALPVPSNVPGAVAPPVACVITTATLPDCRQRLRQRSEAPTWLIDFDYLPTENLLFYGKYARGYRQGSINLFGAQGFQTHGEEEVDAYEIGAKTSFAGPIPGRFNVAVFYNDLKDQQIQVGFVSSIGAAPPTTGIVNAGTSTIQGVEVEAALQLRKGLSLSLSYAYLDTEIESLVVPPLPPGGLFDLFVPLAVAGGPLALAPENKLSATLTYQLPLAASVGNMSLSANYVYTDEQLSTFGTPFGTLPSSEVVNLSLNWARIGGTRAEASLFATNVTDEETRLSVPGFFNTVGAEFQAVGLPRMFGVRVRYSFGD